MSYEYLNLTDLDAHPLGELRWRRGGNGAIKRAPSLTGSRIFPT
jgi:hypothetical protein